MENLIKIQAELKAPKNQYNNFGKYKYRNQEDILEALKPLLAKYKCTLTIQDEIKAINEVIYCEATATIKDSKNEFSVKAQAGIDVNKKGMDLSQTFGSSSSYARKYALNGLFLIDDTKDADTTEQSKVTTANIVNVPNDVLIKVTKSLSGIKSKSELEEYLKSDEYKSAKQYPQIVNLAKSKNATLKVSA